MTQVGDVVDAVIAAGATRVTGVRFTLKDMPGAEQQALKLASAAALARAKAMAEGVGRNIDRVVRLDETGSTVDAAAPAPMMMRAMAAQADAPADAGDTPATSRCA